MRGCSFKLGVLAIWVDGVILLYLVMICLGKELQKRKLFAEPAKGGGGG